MSFSILSAVSPLLQNKGPPPEPIIVSGSNLFSGASQYIRGSNANIPTGTGNFTIEFWFRLTNRDNTMGIVSCGGYSDNAWRVFVSYPGRPYKVSFQLHGTLPLTGAATLVTGVWYHYAIVVNYSGTTYMYINGILDASGNMTSTNITQTSFNVGKTYDDLNQEFFRGYITNVRLSNIALYSGTNTSVANFTVPTSTISTSHAASTNKAALSSSNCLLLLKSVDNATRLIDSAQYNITMTNFGSTFDAATPFQSL